MPCCCGAVTPRVTAALLGRFLPRLGPLATASGPFFCASLFRRCLFGLGAVILRADLCDLIFAVAVEGSAPTPPRLGGRMAMLIRLQPGKAAALAPGSRQSHRRGFRDRPRRLETKRNARSGAHP